MTCARRGPTLTSGMTRRLKDVQGKAIFAPYERLSKEEFEKLGYPKPHVDLTESRNRAKERFKRDLAAANP